jgi:hypothetical protein
MASRLQLQSELEELLGSRNVYFQPPASVKMQYPAIRFRLNDIEKDHADDGVYRGLKSYELILIDPNPDSIYVDKIIQLPYCRFDRHYPADNLNHYVFTLYC